MIEKLLLFGVEAVFAVAILFALALVRSAYVDVQNDHANKAKPIDCPYHTGHYIDGHETINFACYNPQRDGKQERK